MIQARQVGNMLSKGSEHKHRWVLETSASRLPRPTPDPATQVVSGTCDCGGKREFRGSVDEDWRSWRAMSRVDDSIRIVLKTLTNPLLVRVHVAAFAIVAAWALRHGPPARMGAGFLGLAAWGVGLTLNLGALLLRSFVSGSPEGHAAPPAGGGIVMTGSISSTVKLDYDHGTAEKIYLPTPFVRFLYRLSFQGPFPYARNGAALEAACQRRRIAGLLTKAWFGENMVAQALDLRCESDGRYTLVTELVRGTAPRDPEHAKLMLQQVTSRFLDAGLATWQVGHYNPRAVGNLIERADGSYRIIDLESNLVTPVMPVAAILRAVRQLHYPSFDDIDVPRLEAYLEQNRGELVAVLGEEAFAELEDAATDYGRSQATWHRAELRLPGKLLRGALTLSETPLRLTHWLRPKSASR